MRWASTIVAAVLLAAGVATAQNPTPSPSPAPCRTPEYRQFDFWLGDWNVHDPSGALVGTNRITREYDGCVLQEHWVAAGSPPQTGSSFNTWSPGAKKWHQTWVDSTGGFLLLDGELQGGVMTLRGDTRAGDGGIVQHRIAWTPLPDGRVRQLWERSRDQGKTWTVVFDGTYLRKKPDGGR